MALEIKLRPRKSTGSNSREVAVFVSLDARQFQNAGTIMLSEEEIDALRWTATMKVLPPGDNGDMVLTNEDGA